MTAPMPRPTCETCVQWRRINPKSELGFCGGPPGGFQHEGNSCLSHLSLYLDYLIRKLKAERKHPDFPRWMEQQKERG
jgi:hypothetical protein